MPVITERAPAKINLTLEVLGRRLDGYHELLSLVAFAGLGDVLSLDTDQAIGLAASGPFAAEISGPNIVETALRLLGEQAPQLKLGAVHLEKRLPVAAGIGGGSADAAALLRAVAKANSEHRERFDWTALAVRLGADVAVCLRSRAAWMSGAGEVVEPLAVPLPALNVVLVNPRARVPADKTAQVFRAFAASAISAGRRPATLGKRQVGSRVELMALLAAGSNHLEAPAIAVVPELVDVLEALSALPGIELVRLSGAGPTCYGIFPSAHTAEAAAAALKSVHSAWWIEATVLADIGLADNSLRGGGL
jgi:4-diphosphocytidyl-2-C-methyl-D-erythritol kinase